MIQMIESLSFWRILLAISLIYICKLVVKYFVKPYFILRKYKKIPGALCIYRPIFGTLPDLTKDFNKHGDTAYSLKKLVRDQPNTRLIAMTIGSDVALIFTDVELIKDFLNKQTKIASKDLRGSLRDPEIGIGLFIAEGEQWKAQRKLISQVFHFDYMNRCLPTVNRTLREWIESNCSSNSSIVNIHEQSKTFTSTVIWRIFFGEESFTEEKASAKNLIALTLKNSSESITRIISPFMLLFGPKFFKLGLRACDRQFERDQAELISFFKSKLEMFKKNVLEEKQSGKKSDRPRNLIELLIDESLKEDAVIKMEDKDVLAQVQTFFVAGTDTTAQVIIMSHYVLGTNEEIQNKLREDVNRVLGDVEEIKYEHLMKMEYMGAFIKEILRCYGPATSLFPRILTENASIGDINLKKGTMVNVSILGSSQNPKYFPHPEDFRPERWLEKEEKDVRDQLAFLPFSAGAKRCIGEQLAYLEAKSFIAEIIQKFKINIQKPYNLKMWQGLVYEAKDPLKVVYTKLT